MSKEFEIVSKINLDTDEATKKWQKFKTDAKDLEKIDIKLNISNLEVVKKELQGLLELSNKLSNIKTSGIGGLDNKSLAKQQSEQTKLYGKMYNDISKQESKYQQGLLRQYTSIENTISKLQAQMGKGIGDESIGRTTSEIEKLKTQLDDMYSLLSNSSKAKLEILDFERENRELTEFNKNISKIEETANSALSRLNGSNFLNLDDVSRVDHLKNELKELIAISQNPVDLNFDTGQALNRISEITQEIRNLEKVDNLRGSFEQLEGTIRDAFGEQYVAEFRSELQSLEGIAKGLDGSFANAFGGLSSYFKEAQTQIKQMNDQTKDSGRFMSDFAGSFTAYTAGNIVGDGIVGAIRGIKESYLEIDAAITNVKKVASDVEVNTVDKLDSIRNKSIEIAKDVGQSSADVLNAIADTVQAGVSKTLEGSIEIAKQTMQLSNVGEIDQELASSVTSTMIRGFNIDPVSKYKREVNGVSKEITGLTVSMDMLNFASNEYGTNVQQLVEGMQNGGNVLGSYGVTIDDTVAMMTAGIEVLGNGSKVGNGLKSIGVNLMGMKANAKSGRSNKLPILSN